MTTLKTTSRSSAVPLFQGKATMAATTVLFAQQGFEAESTRECREIRVTLPRADLCFYVTMKENTLQLQRALGGVDDSYSSFNWRLERENSHHSARRTRPVEIGSKYGKRHTNVVTFLPWFWGETNHPIRQQRAK